MLTIVEIILNVVIPVVSLVYIIRATRELNEIRKEIAEIKKEREN